MKNTTAVTAYLRKTSVVLGLAIFGLISGMAINNDYAFVPQWILGVSAIASVTTWISYDFKEIYVTSWSKEGTWTVLVAFSIGMALLDPWCGVWAFTLVLAWLDIFNTILIWSKPGKLLTLIAGH